MSTNAVSREITTTSRAPTYLGLAYVLAAAAANTMSELSKTRLAL